MNTTFKIDRYWVFPNPLEFITTDSALPMSAALKHFLSNKVGNKCNQFTKLGITYAHFGKKQKTKNKIALYCI
jgi:hypothetical protein